MGLEITHVINVLQNVSQIVATYIDHGIGSTIRYIVSIFSDYSSKRTIYVVVTQLLIKESINREELTRKCAAEGQW